VGSPSRDAFKRWHKDLQPVFWATDIDFALIDGKKDDSFVVAVLDYKSRRDAITIQEAVLYNFFTMLPEPYRIPVFIVRGNLPSQEPIFGIQEYLGAQIDWVDKRVNASLNQICDGINEEEFGGWEYDLRKSRKEFRSQIASVLTKKAPAD